MQFATFYKMSTGYVAGTIPPRFDGEKEPIPALGSDGVAIIDGRLSVENAANVARDIARRRGFVGFTIERGARFTDSRIARKLELIRETVTK